MQRHHIVADLYIQVISLQLRVSFPFSDSSWNSTVVARENMVDSLETVRILQPPKRTRSYHWFVLETTSVSTFVFIDISTSGRRGGIYHLAGLQYFPKCLPLDPVNMVGISCVVTSGLGPFFFVNKFDTRNIVLIVPQGTFTLSVFVFVI